MSATLHINRSETNCAECGATCSTKAISCPRCGETFTHVGSGYMGIDQRMIMAIRPDLEPDFYEPLSDDELVALRHDLEGPTAGEEP